tara:strand:- start:2461 stop:2628 length:168 start_codon:yes stop_codon:yes gene_type:complete
MVSIQDVCSIILVIIGLVIVVLLWQNGSNVNNILNYLHNHTGSSSGMAKVIKSPR